MFHVFYCFIYIHIYIYIIFLYNKYISFEKQHVHLNLHDKEQIYVVHLFCCFPFFLLLSAKDSLLFLTNLILRF